MPTPTFTTDWADDDPLTEDILDAFSDSIVSFLVTTKLDSDNLQNGAVGEAQLASASVSASKIQSNAVTSAKIIDDAVTTSKILDANVTTAKIAANAITRAKLEAVGQQISSSSGVAQVSSTSATAATNLSDTITTSGRPVFLVMQSGDTSNAAAVVLASSFSGSAFIWYYRDSTPIAKYEFAPTALQYIPITPVFLDVVAAGTYTYSVKIAGDGTHNMILRYYKLVAFEL